MIWRIFSPKTEVILFHKHNWKIKIEGRNTTAFTIGRENFLTSVKHCIDLRFQILSVAPFSFETLCLLIGNILASILMTKWLTKSLIIIFATCHKTKSAACCWRSELQSLWNMGILTNHSTVFLVKKKTANHYENIKNLKHNYYNVGVGNRA